MTKQLDLIHDAPMVRNTDPQTSRESAEVIRPELGKIQRIVLGAFAHHGPMTARQLEQLDTLKGYAPSTARKRLSELWKAGYLETCGVDRSQRAPAAIYRVTERE